MKITNLFQNHGFFLIIQYLTCIKLFFIQLFKIYSQSTLTCSLIWFIFFELRKNDTWKMLKSFEATCWWLIGWFKHHSQEKNSSILNTVFQLFQFAQNSVYICFWKRLKLPGFRWRDFGWHFEWARASRFSIALLSWAGWAETLPPARRPVRSCASSDLSPYAERPRWKRCYFSCKTTSVSKINIVLGGYNAKFFSAK